MRKYYILFIIFFFGLLSGCSDDLTHEGIPPFSNFETTLNILNEDGDSIKVIKQGDPIILNFSFQNISGEIQTVRFSDYQQYDLQVYDSQGVLVWNWANGKLFPQAETELVFNPGETKVFEETWDQASNEGIQVPTGIYNVYVNRYWNPDMSTGPVQIIITDDTVDLIIGKPDFHLVSQDELDTIIELFDLNGLNYDDLQFYRIVGPTKISGLRAVRCFQFVNDLKLFTNTLIFGFDEFDVYDGLTGEVISEIDVSSEFQADYRDILALYLIELDEDDEFHGDKDEIRNGNFVLEFGYYDLNAGISASNYEFITAWKINPKDKTYPYAYISDVSEEVIYYFNGIIVG